MNRFIQARAWPMLADQAHPDSHSALPAATMRDQAVMAWATHAVAYAQAVRTTALAPHPDQIMLDSYVGPIGAALRLITIHSHGRVVVCPGGTKGPDSRRSGPSLLNVHSQDIVAVSIT